MHAEIGTDMFKGSFDILGYLIVGTVLYGFACIVIGYGILFRQALRAPDTRAAMKRVWDWRGNEALMDARGLKWIYRGALIGILTFAGLLVLVVCSVPRR